MLIVALFVVALYTVFVPIFTGKKRHLFIGLVLLVLLSCFLHVVAPASGF